MSNVEQTWLFVRFPKIYK